MLRAAEQEGGARASSVRLHLTRSEPACKLAPAAVVFAT